MYDIIGDIHGHATPLKRLLSRLGYRQEDGVWRHPERQVLFLGDFIDRGPEQLEVVDIAQRMVAAGQAQAIMGNHEFNAIAWATDAPDTPGVPLRPHTEKNRRQHQAYLAQVGEGSPLHRAHIDWFRTLPVYLELEGLRLVHACWHPPSMTVLEDYLDAEKRIMPQAWEPLTAKGTAPFEAAETLLKGLEIPLPDGHYFHDKDGNPRTEIRTRWWADEALTYRNLAMVPGDEIHRIPHEPVPGDILPGYDADKPVFVGHYWLEGIPERFTPQIACLDYSIAGGGDTEETRGKLAAYRWDGEQTLGNARFVWVASSAEDCM